MAAIKFTKNELKKQKDGLKRFQRYLPTLQLKKQQLQMVIRTVETQEREKREAQEALRGELDSWITLFGEDVSFKDLVRIVKIDTDTGNIAGVDIPVFREMVVTVSPYDLFQYPLWVDAAVVKVKELLALDAEVKILQQQRDLLGQELRVTSQRVNLFEKVKIPETKENIRMIRIYLGDQQTAAVVRGKIAKNKLVS